LSSIEQTRHTIDPLFKPLKARLSRYRVSVFPCLLYLYLSLSLFAPLYIKREGKGDRREREDDGQGDLDDWGIIETASLKTQVLNSILSGKGDRSKRKKQNC
jgi:hypothetical protein